MRLCIFARAMAAHRAGSYVWPFDLLSRDLARRGHVVTVLTTAHPDDSAPPGGAGQEGLAPAGGAVVTRDAGVEVRYLAGTTPEKIDAAFWRASAAAFDALHPTARFEVTLGRDHSVWGLLAQSRFAGALPLVSHKGTYPAWLHRLDLARRPGLRLTVAVKALAAARRDPVAARCLTRSDRVVCVAPALERAVRRTLWWRPPRTTCIPYGFDLAGFAATRERPPRVGPPVVLYVGRLTAAKGAEALLDILARLARGDAVLEAIGPVDPAYRDRLLGVAERLGVAARLRLPGPAPHAALPDRLRAGDAFLFPSTHPEGLSKAVMEAMAMGLPVVAYALPGFEGLIEDAVDGCLTPPRRPDLAAARLDALLADPAEAARMGAAARARIAADFAPARAARAWDDLLETVVREHAAAGRRSAA